MKKKIIVGVVTFSLLAGTGTGVYAYNQKILADKAAQLEQLRVETLENAENAVDSLYNSTRTMLADDLEKKIKNAENAVGKVEEDKAKAQLSEEISKVKEIAKIQQEVYNTLENGVLTESVTDEQLEEITQKLIIIKSQNKSIYTHLSEYLSEANDQLASIDAALKKVKEAEKSLNRKVYNSALTLVDEVKNEVKKDELKKQLAVVNEKLVAMEEEAKRKKEEEERLAAEKAAAEQAAAKQQQNTVASSSAKSTSSSATNSGKSTSSSATNSGKSNTGTTSSSSNKSTSKSNQSSSGSKDSTSTSKPNNSGNAPAKSGGSSGSSSGGSSGSSSGGSSGSSSGGTDWDKVGEQLENHDWGNTGSGEIDEGGNTWDTWE